MSQLKTYVYHGPQSGFTLPDGTDVTLCDGKERNLPPDDPFVASLVRQRRLIEVAPAPQKKPSRKAGDEQTPKEAP